MSNIKKTDPAFLQWRDRFVPVEIKRIDGKKKVYPKKWKNGETYDDRDFDKNSIALRTGNGIGMIDVDTKDLGLLNDVWRPLVSDFLEKRSTLIVETYSGYHIYVDSTDFQLKTTTKKGAEKSEVPYIDFRGEGGMAFIFSDAPKVSYKVISNAAPQKISKKLKKLLPQKEDKKKKEETPEWAKGELGTYSSEEVLKMLLHTSKKYQGRDWLLSRVADVYKLLNSKEDLEKIIDRWIKTNWDNKLGSHEEDVVAQVIDEVQTENFGRDWNGGTLILEAKEGGYKFKDADIAGKQLSLEVIKKIFEINLADVDITPIQLEGLEKPVLFKGALHTIFGIYGTNKTSIAIILAGKAATKENMDAFYLDAENNGKKMREFAKECGVNYIPSDISSQKIKKLIENDVDCSNAIIILDSFSAMLPENASNNDAKDTTQTMRTAVGLSSKLGATVIVIEHATAQSYDKNGDPLPESAKMEGSQSGKLKLTHMAYKAVPNDIGDYRAGTQLRVARSREPDVTPMRSAVEILYEGDDDISSIFKVGGKS